MSRLREKEATAKSERCDAELEALDVETALAEHRKNKRNADQLGVEVIGMLWEVSMERIC